MERDQLECYFKFNFVAGVDPRHDYFGDKQHVSSSW